MPPKPTGFQHLVLLAFVAGATTVGDVVRVTNAYTEDVEIVLNELEACGVVRVIHRTLGVYELFHKQ
jgi:hypothetical protein